MLKIGFRQLSHLSVLIALLLFVLPFLSKAQESGVSNMSLNGYVKYMNTVMFNNSDSAMMVDNLVHNRLNYKWYINKTVKLDIEARSRLIYGDFIKDIPGYADMIKKDNGYFHFFTNNTKTGKTYVLNTSIDRAFLEFNPGKATITLGRQRINWGQSFTWNPNDIFNTYSFFDFDYEERPGSDALRIRYYPNYTSAADVAVKIDKNNQVTAAGLYRFNKWNYDIQVLAGIIDTTDYIIGAGWSGSIKNIKLTGELSYFHPQKNATDSVGIMLITSGVNYTFNNAVNVSFEGIYNGYFEKLNLESFAGLYFMPLSVKTCSFSKFSWFGQLTYPFHPLLTGTLAIMYYPSLGNGYFLMPSLTYSVSNNFECGIYGQRFGLKFNSEYETMNLLFLRLRWSF